MKQFYVLNRVILAIIFTLVLFSCQEEQEFITITEEIINDDSSSKQFKVPSLLDVQSNFMSEASYYQIFTNKQNDKSNMNDMLGFGVDWELSFPTQFDSEQNIDILYTPIHFNSSKRLKSFIASATINDTLVSQIVTLAYVGQPSLEYFNGYIFFHDLTGAFITGSYYESGNKIKTAYVVKTKSNSTNKNSCIEDQWYYLATYGIDGYEEFFSDDRECLGSTTVVAEIAMGDGDGSGGGSGSDSDFPTSSDMYIPVYSGGGGGSTSSDNLNTSNSGNAESVSTLESAYWQETIAPNEAMITTLASEINLNATQTQWLQNTQNSTELQMLPYQIINFLDKNLWSNEAKNFAQEAIGVLMDDSLTNSMSSLSSKMDYEARIKTITNRLRNYGDLEDKLMADYIDSLLPEFENLNMGEVHDLYKLVVWQQKNLIRKYFQAVLIPIAEASLPFIELALTDASLGLAIPLISRLPLTMVLRGLRLEKTIRSIAKLGKAGRAGSHIRIIPNSSYTKAITLFNKLTQNAINITRKALPDGRVIYVADMGEGNFITFRNFDYSSTVGLQANIDLKFPKIWSKNRELKFVE